VVGPTLFVVSFLTQGALRPEYDPLRHPISSLALGGPAGWVQSATFLLTGGLVTAYAWGLRRCGLGRWLPILVAAVGLGLVGAGIFPADPINGYPPGSPVPAPATTTGRVHDLSSTPVFIALPAACLVFAARMARAGNRRWARYSRITAAVFLGCFVLSAVGFGGVDPLVATGGLWQRLCIVVGFGWLAGVATWLSRHDGSGREWHP
jgi:hypothetical membrane protein